MNDSIERMTKQFVAFRDARDWKQFHNPKDQALSLVLEAAELLEHMQWKQGDELQTYIHEHKNEIGEELADVFAWVLIMSHDLGIDLVKAFEDKMKKNEAKYPVEKAKGRSAKYTKLSE